MSKSEKKNKNDKQPRKSGSSIYTGGLFILMFILLITIFLMMTQPDYYRQTIILFGLGAAVLLLLVILFSILQKPVQPPGNPINIGSIQSLQQQNSSKEPHKDEILKDESIEI